MKRILLVGTGLTLALLAGCGSKSAPDPKAEAPPPTQVEQEADASLVKVEHPEQFPVTVAAKRSISPELNVTGVVGPDVSRNVPVISLASGRVVEIGAKLGDEVKKGQILMKVQSTDISTALADYRRANADHTLAKAQLSRAKLLLDNGAIAAKEVEVAQDAEQKAEVDVQTSLERIKVLGADMNNPAGVVEIRAPITGVITEQNITNSGGVKTLDNSPNLFTISDLSEVWVMCDVYENDLAAVRLGESADIHLNAYPDRVFKGRVDNIGPTLDPAIRTAKVRLALPNPGIMRFGMFVTATFHGLSRQTVTVVPATAILHLHDRDWVYSPAGEKSYRRIEVVAGKMAADKMQEVVSGLSPGERVVSNALVLQNTAEQ